MRALGKESHEADHFAIGFPKRRNLRQLPPDVAIESGKELHLSIEILTEVVLKFHCLST